MRDYLLSIFFNFIFFILIGTFYHIIAVKGPIDNRIWILLLVGSLFYAPAYLISSIPILFKKQIKNPFLRLVVFPVNLSILIFGMLFIDSGNTEIVWLFFVIAQLLSSIIIFSLNSRK